MTDGNGVVDPCVVDESVVVGVVDGVVSFDIIVVDISVTVIVLLSSGRLEVLSIALRWRDKPSVNNDASITGRFLHLDGLDTTMYSTSEKSKKYIYII